MHCHYVKPIEDIRAEVVFRRDTTPHRLQYGNSASPGFYLRLLTHFSARTAALATYGLRSLEQEQE